jgi:hypothetical protein
VLTWLGEKGDAAFGTVEIALETVLAPLETALERVLVLSCCVAKFEATVESVLMGLILVSSNVDPAERALRSAERRRVRAVGATSSCMQAAGQPNSLKSSA